MTLTVLTDRPLCQCLISFGSNLGTRESLIAEAARTIAASHLVSEFRASRLFETPPIGGPGGQEPFLNAVAALETTASAKEILLMLQEIENHLGRTRRRRWDARSIDLDVVLHGKLVGGAEGLIVPHPRYTARQFVLRPACDVAAHYRDPRFNWTLQELADHLSQGVPSMALVGGDVGQRSELCRRLTQEHGIETYAADPICEPMAVLGNAPAPNRDAPTNREAPTSPPLESTGGGETIRVGDRPWVSAYIPLLPSRYDSQAKLPTVPRLITRIQKTTARTRWPAPHQMWPSGWSWPEYRLEIDDLDWAVSEVASALDSMRCPAEPLSDSVLWWQD